MRRTLFCAASGVLILSMGCSVGADGLFFIPGSGSLPGCTDPPETDLTGRWYDNGTITIESDGCAGTTMGDTLTVCGLDWEVSQAGNDVTLVVDEEYRIDGRLCGDQLHLSGGWWLPTRDEPFGCTYEDDTAQEVGIEAAGNVLTLAEGRLSGTLVVRGDCLASNAMTLDPN